MGRLVTVLFAVFGIVAASAALNVRHVLKGGACVAEDLEHRKRLQNKLADLCEDMCRKVDAYPDCGQCPKFVPPDSTPGVMTWDELLDHMDNLSGWGADQLKAWRQRASSSLQTAKQSLIADDNAGMLYQERACAVEDLEHRVQVQNKLAGSCEDMCRKVGAFPNCGQCPKFAPPDSTPGVMTWDELLQHMDNLSSWGADQLKEWRQRASSALQTAKQSAIVHPFNMPA